WPWRLCGEGLPRMAIGLPGAEGSWGSLTAQGRNQAFRVGQQVQSIGNRGGYDVGDEECLDRRALRPEHDDPEVSLAEHVDVVGAVTDRHDRGRSELADVGRLLLRLRLTRTQADPGQSELLADLVEPAVRVGANQVHRQILTQ